MYTFLKTLFIVIACFSVQRLSAQSFESNMRKAYILLSIAQERDRQTAEILDDIKTKRIRVEEDLIDAQENPRSISKIEKEKLQSLLKSLKKQEAKATKVRIDASLYLTEVTDLIKANEQKRAKYIADYEKKYGNLDNVITVESNNPPNITQEESRPIDKIAVLEQEAADTKAAKTEKKDTPQSTKKRKKDTQKSTINDTPQPQIPQYRTYDAKSDVAINPPAPDCVVTFDGIDDFTKKKKKEIGFQSFFRHTEDFMKPAMKDKDYINCDISASRIQGGFYFINLNFTILTKEAQKSFGFLDKGSLFVFKLINGEIVSLYSTKTDIGTVDANNGTTIYRVGVQLNGAEVKALTSSELDVVRVAWSTGYEDYEIFNMDILINMFKCLDKENK